MILRRRARNGSASGHRPAAPRDARATPAAAEERYGLGEYRRSLDGRRGFLYVAEFGVNPVWFYVSPEIEAVLGFTPAQWLRSRTGWYEHVHPSDRERVIVEEVSCLTQRTPLRSIYRMVTRDGTVVLVSDEAEVIRDERQRPLLKGAIVELERAGATSSVSAHDTIARH